MCSIPIQLEQEPRIWKILPKVPDEGELVVDMFHHRQQVDGEAYQLLVVGLNAIYSCRT